MLYIKPIETITWNNIEEFADQRIQEGANLDYKADFPKELQKTIAAMANTLGGIIIIGIAEDDENRPVIPINGISFQRGLSERVMNIILSNITPPVFPEINVCPNEEKSQALIIIRIPQSHQTPHAISGNTKVYLRTGNRNKPENLAQIDEIEWLKDHRGKSVTLKENLYSRADDRFSSFYMKHLIQEQERKGEQNPLSRSCLTLSLCPNFPKESFGSPPEIQKLLGGITVPDYYSQLNCFPIYDNINGTIVQDGSVFKSFSSVYAFYTELNCFGLFFFRQLSTHLVSPQGGETINLIRENEILARLDEFIDSGIRFYNKLEFSGILEFRMLLNDIYNCSFSSYNPNATWHSGQDEIRNSPDQDVIFTDTFLASRLHDEKQRLILRSAQKVAWTFGSDTSQADLDDFYEKYKKIKR